MLFIVYVGIEKLCMILLCGAQDSIKNDACDRSRYYNMYVNVKHVCM
jgi:hypothetical protein